MTAATGEFVVEHVSPHIWAVRTPHVNWAVYVGPDGVTLVDSGYPGDYDSLTRSLLTLGVAPADVSAVLLTHAHVDHLGGAVRLASEFSTPVLTGSTEARHARREFLEQVPMAAILRNVWRPGVLRWGRGIARLLGPNAAIAVPQASEFSMADERVAVPGRPRAYSTPGHTTGHTVFDFDDESVVLTGDSLITGHPTSRLAGPQLLPTIFHHDPDAARGSLSPLGASRSRVLVPGHGPVWRGESSTAVDGASSQGFPW